LRRAATAALLLLALSGPAAAQGAPGKAAPDAARDASPPACDGALADCAEREAVDWDRRLNEGYRTLASALPAERRAALRDAQRRWIAFRDAECRFRAAGGGAIARLRSAGCVRALTESRATELARMARGD